MRQNNCSQRHFLQQVHAHPALRACFDTPVFNELSDWIAKLANAKKISPALQYGNFSSIIYKGIPGIPKARAYIKGR